MSVEIRKMKLIDFFTMKRIENDKPDVVDGFGNLIKEKSKYTADKFKRFYETVNIFLSLISLKLAFSKYIIFLAIQKNNVVGLLFLEIRKDDVNLGIFVKKENRSSGIGKKLMENAIRWSMKKKKNIKLCVWEHNKVALEFYKKNGFKTTKKLYFMEKVIG